MKRIMDLKIAVFALTRGYPEDQSLYSSLLTRNDSIYNQINKFRKIPVDVILFHEGNINDEDQRHINKNSKDKIIFKNVSQYFKKENITLDGETKFTLGYRQMCRFNMYYVWKELSDYDYILRIDEDILISKFDPHVFEYMYSKKINYLTGRFTKDTHTLTNRTLPYFLQAETDMNVDKVYNHKNPYTNVYASSVNFWKEYDVQELLKKIALSDKQLINRWGDHTVQGLILNHKKEPIRLFKKLEYNHDSHSLIIKNNLIRNLTVNSKFNPVSVTGGLFVKFKRWVKNFLKSPNKYDF